MKSKRHIFENAGILLALVIVTTLTLQHSGTASGYPPPPTAQFSQLTHRRFLPLILNRYPVPPKNWSGMHLGNRYNTGWTNAMLAPFDPTVSGKSAAWPQIVVALSNQVFNIGRDSNCHITSSTISVRNSTIYNYLKRASLGGTTAVMIRVYPSPGNFEQSIQPGWENESTRPPGRTLNSVVGYRPGGWSLCDNAWRFRPVDDVADEMLAIQRYAISQGWQVYGFEPANEPNIEWYFNQTLQQCTTPCNGGMHVSLFFPSPMSTNIAGGVRASFITEADVAPPQWNWGNPCTNKDVNPTCTSNSLRDFLDYERNASGGAGARRIAAWLLSDDTGVATHTWAQAWNGTGFRLWFQCWWYSQEPIPFR